MPSAVEWLEGLSPWPAEFGLGTMRDLLARLGDPQRRFDMVHVVGTNGKSTATRTIEEMLRAAGLGVGAYLSPHVRAWSERIRVDGAEADFDEALERVRSAAEVVGATQFETLTAAAFATFADAHVDVAAVEAGLGGRHDATNVVDAPVVLLTNVGLDHTDVLGATRDEIAREKLAVVADGATVVLPDEEFAALVPHAHVVIGGAREAAAAYLGRAVDPVAVELPGRLELRDGEVWDGAHNLDGARWLVDRLPAADYTLVVSILRDKDVGAMLEVLSAAGSRFVATQSSNPRTLPAAALAEAARAHFATVTAVPDPAAALARARQDPPVLVTGSLYLLADMYAREEQRVK